MGLAFIYPALPTCLVVYVQKSDFHLINAFCVVIVVKKCRLLCLAQVVLAIYDTVAKSVTRSIEASFFIFS